MRQLPRRSIWHACAIAALLAANCAVRPAWAGPIRVRTGSIGARAILYVNNQAVASLGPSNGASAASRAARVEARLNGLAASGRAPAFTVGKVDGRWSVVVGGGAVVTPYPPDAARAGIPRRALAHQWAARLRSAWATPYLRVLPDSIVLGIGAARSVRVAGAATGAFQAVSDAPDRVAVRAVPGGLRVTAIQPGRATITIVRGGATVAFPVRAMRYAGSVRPVTVQVTGASVPGDLLADVVDAEAARCIRLEPGAWSAIPRRPTFPIVWTQGDRLRLSVPIRLAGPGYLPVDTSLPITVIRRRLPQPRNVTLFYSNRPETIRDARVLFSHSLDGAPARLLYHHQNMGSSALTLAVDVANDGPADIPVQIVDGDVAPSEDCVLAGHLAAVKYLKRSQSGTGVIVTIPAGGRRRLMARRLGAGDTLSGLMLIRPLKQHGRLSVSVRSELPNQDLQSARGVQTDTVFPDPDKVVDADYRVDGPWTYVPIGKVASSNADGVRLDGDYGVLYTLRLKVENPTERQRSVRVFFEPRAGEARAAMIINGELTETGSTFPPSEVRVVTISLAPRQTRTVTLVTMPAAGSSYPAAFIVRG